MATLREIRQRISSVKSTQQITKAMKMVAAAKLRRAQENIMAIRPYAYEMRTLIGHISAKVEDTSQIKLMKKRPVERVLIVPVAADRGLCGAFNGNVEKAAIERIKKYEHIDCQLYTVGRKATEFFRKRNYNVYKDKINFFNHLSFDNALELSRDLVSLFENGAFDRIEIVYNEFKSALQQNLVVETFLPFESIDEDESSYSGEYIYEPDMLSILNAVIPKHLNTQVWRILLESNASEHGARMTAMDNATENAEEIKSKLTLHYNRARQAAITKELSEIVGGAEALKE